MFIKKVFSFICPDLLCQVIDIPKWNIISFSQLLHGNMSWHFLTDQSFQNNDLFLYASRKTRVARKKAICSLYPSPFTFLVSCLTVVWIITSAVLWALCFPNTHLCHMHIRSYRMLYKCLYKAFVFFGVCCLTVPFLSVILFLYPVRCSKDGEHFECQK